MQFAPADVDANSDILDDSVILQFGVFTDQVSDGEIDKIGIAQVPTRVQRQSLAALIIPEINAELKLDSAMQLVVMNKRRKAAEVDETAGNRHIGINVAAL